MVLQTNKKPQQKTLEPLLSPFLLHVSTKGETSRHMNSLLQHSWISKLLTLKADAQYSKATQTRLQDLKRLYKHKTKQFSHKFCFSLFKNILWFKKLLYTDFYLIDTRLRTQFGQPGKRARVQILQTPRYTLALIQSPI